MSPEQAHKYVCSLYEHLLKRTPTSKELERWVADLVNSKSTDEVFYAFVNSEEYKANSPVVSQFAAGHYYSPVVDPTTVKDYVKKERQASAATIEGIELAVDDMEAFWRRSAPIIAATPFQESKNDQHRYYYEAGFTHGDAIILRAMFADLKPRNVVEIGSGFSSACMLDCADEFGLATTFTFIDPYPARLKRLLRPDDYRRVTIVEELAQNTNLTLYRSLGPGDILFIDSTHVLKTGSDVHFELFHILPCLQRGVTIHFHDIQFPFEYPDRWIFELNKSWNEIYALRAFLMYNSKFRIKFWGGCFAKLRASLSREVSPVFLRHPGGSIWLERA